MTPQIEELNQMTDGQSEACAANPVSTGNRNYDNNRCMALVRVVLSDIGDAIDEASVALRRAKHGTVASLAESHSPAQRAAALELLTNACHVEGQRLAEAFAEVGEQLEKSIREEAASDLAERLSADSRTYHPIDGSGHGTCPNCGHTT